MSEQPRTPGDRPRIADEYLGDGVYASFDGYLVWLDLRAQEPTLPITKIGLEPEVLAALDIYRERIKRAFREEEDT